MASHSACKGFCSLNLRNALSEDMSPAYVLSQQWCCSEADTQIINLSDTPTRLRRLQWESLHYTEEKPLTVPLWTEIPTEPNEPPEVISSREGWKSLERCLRSWSAVNVKRNQFHSRIQFPRYGLNRRRIFSHVNSNDFYMVRSMLETDKTLVNHCNERGCSSLHLVVPMNFKAMAKLLLDFGANPNAKDKTGSTPLHLAALYMNVDLVELLLENGANIAEKDMNGNTPLQLAISQLNHFTNATNPNSELLFRVVKVIDMLHIHTAGEEAKLEKLSEQFSTSLQLSNSESLVVGVRKLLGKLGIADKSETESTSPSLNP